MAGFLLRSAFFHFLIITPAAFGRYTAGLRESRTTFRWAEYSVSSSIMIVLSLVAKTALAWQVYSGALASA